MTQATRPIPREDAESAPFWRAVHEGRFVLPACGDCGKFHFYPRAVCPHCRSLNISYQPAAGKGVIYSYTVHRQPAGAEFAADVPYVLALVTLDEGPRMLTRITGAPPESVRIGQPVSFKREHVTDEVSLPFFEIKP